MRGVLSFAAHASLLLKRPGAVVPRRMASFAAVPATEEAKAVAANAAAVRERIAVAAGGRDVALIAVSKLKPLALIAAAHAGGQADFGENYVQELVEKSAEADTDAVRWHFIGRLQSNKVRALCGVRGLAAIHTVSSAKLANKIDRCWAELKPDGAGPLAVFLQVNTSGEDAKGGVAPAAAPELAAVIAACADLTLEGLMCIGKYTAAEGDAAVDFATLAGCRDACASALGVDPASLALSMGMSHDFETAIASGATHVRVGSTIFGARPPK